MGGLFNDVVAFAAEADFKDALRREFGQVSGSRAQETSILSAAALIAALADWTTQPAGSAWLETDLPLVDSSLSRIAELRSNDDYHRFGEGVVTRLFGPRSDRVVAHLAESVELDTDCASIALAATAWVTVGHLARRGREIGVAELPAMLRREERDLRAEGWGAWIDTALDGVSTDGAETRPSARAATGSVLDPASTTPVGPAGPAPAGAPDRDARSRWRRRAAGFVVLLVAVGALAAALRWRGGDRDELATAQPTDDTIESDAGDTTTSAGEVTPTTTASTLATPSTSTTATPIEEAEAPDVPEVVEYSVTLSDPLETVAASGTVDLMLDTVTGEVCYAFDLNGLATPYAAHLHIGARENNGGITVDFGLLDGVDRGCIQASPADLHAAASRPSARYVEAHDPSGAFSVRGQLGIPEGSETDPAPAVEVDDRAHVEIVGGVVLLRGAVPDQETADTFVASYADLDNDSIEVVNELQVVPGTEPPSELVIIADSVLFDVDSAEISADAQDMLIGLAQVLAARPTWSVSAVGHTDSTGSIFHNFSLSLRRASAVQDALTELGAPRLGVTVEGLGPVAPVATNDTPAGRAANRRIDLVVDTSG